MIDMRNDDITKEFDRMFPDRKLGDGILNFDLKVLFPYSNQDIVTIKFGVFDDSILNDEETEDDDRYLFTDTTNNHRHPNKTLITVSKKDGRKVCKIGYPICKPIKELNRYKMMVLKVGIKEKTVTLCFPLDIKLTKNNPIGGLAMLLHHWEHTPELLMSEKTTKKMGFDFTTYECKPIKHKPNKVYNSGYDTHYIHYILGCPEWEEMRENDIELIAFKTGREDLAVVTPAIVIKGQPSEFFVL